MEVAQVTGRPSACHWQGLERVDMVRQLIGFGSARILGDNLEDAPMANSTTGFR
jgi:hypothetical protein